MGSLIIIVAMFALLWLLLIRPQRSAQAQRERVIREVDVGDEILSSGGVYGVVRGVGDDDDQLYVEIAEGVEVRMDRRAVGAIVRPAEADEAEAEDAVDADEGGEADALDEAGEPAPRESHAHGTIERDRG